MNYLFFRAINRYRQNIKWYSFVSIQICIAIVMLYIFSTISFSIGKQYTENKNKAESSLVQVDVLTQDINNTNPQQMIDKNRDLFFSYDDYKTIKNEYGKDLNLLYAVKKKLIYITDNKISEVYLLFVSNEFFNIIYPSKQFSDFSQMNNVLFGSNAKDTIKNGKLVEGEENWYQSLDANSNKISMGNNNTYDMVDMRKLYLENTNKIKTVSLDRFISSEYGNQNSEISLDNAIIIPIEKNLEYLDSIFTKDGDLNLIVSIKFKDTSVYGKILSNILNYLEKEHKQQYTFGNSILFYMSQTQSLLELCKLINLLTVVCIVIVMIGITGLMLLMISKRRKEIALSIAIGATLKQLYFETIFEIILIIGIGGIFGIALSNFLLLKIKFNQFPIVVNYYTPILIFVALLFCGILASLFPIYKIKKIAPDQTLKSI
jgi:ABC-type lipoprotein release transport system permease subunit